MMGWSLGKMIRTHLKPRSFSSRSHGNLTEDVNRFEFGVIETPRFIELYASYGCGPALRPVGCETLPNARPDRLYAYQGDTLCLKVRSIGDGARLEC